MTGLRAFCVAAIVCVLPLASATFAQDTPQPRLLTVTGEGEAKAKPDRATVSAGVVRDGKTAAAALAANSRAMNAVFDTLKRLAIPERAIRTSEISVQPQYPNDSREPPRIAGYRVSNTVTVTVDELGKIGPALDALVSSGVNSLGDIAFGLRDPKPLLARARQAAVEDATAKAQTLARAAGVSLGPIVQISEGGASGPPLPMARRMALAAAEATPVGPGAESVTASVSISWEIR